ncbi:MAG: hypothetical protein PHV36_03415 [Elusimicrobiales bacterium]|nr:hypothetical protein [Elusimicrobiales bacterium]
MTTKINLGLSLTLNVMLGFVILQNNKKPVALSDFRDAVADIRVPAEVLPTPAPETVFVEAAPAAAAVAEQAPAPAPARAQAIIVANDLAAYKQEMAEDRDVVVSNLFRSEKNCDRAMHAAVRRLQVAGKEVLFSCLMPATGGGTFYLIRLVSVAPEIPMMVSSGR